MQISLIGAIKLNELFISLSIRKCLILMLLVHCIACKSPNPDSEWWRGNMHTHTFWSDGQHFPESVAKWYKENGYHFLVFTDHNRIHSGERHITISEVHPAMKEYSRIARENWIIYLEENHNVRLKLKGMAEYRHLYEEPGKFLLIMGEEISERNLVHILAVNIDESFPPMGVAPDDYGKLIQENIERIKDYSNRTGRRTLTALAHPNYHWAITAEDIAEAKDLKFFEVCNASVIYWNEGDAFRVNTDRIWDIALSLRLSTPNGQILYGLATDDSHHYHGNHSGPGRGWVMVKSSTLDTDSLLAAMDNGDFYATTGVLLKEIKRTGSKLFVQIKPVKGITYLTEFIGTRAGFDPSGTPVLDPNGNEVRTTRVYSNEIGKVLSQSKKTRSVYNFKGDELYVRVRITSSADHIDPVNGKILGKQRAWLQPIKP